MAILRPSRPPEGRTQYAAKLLDRSTHEGDWLLGAVNFDEDLHFSSYYLRASVAAHSVEQGVPGYTFLIAHFQDFTERYYLLRDECHAVAASLTFMLMRSAEWFTQVLREIETRSTELANAFPPRFDSDASLLEADDLFEIYRAHHERHTRLYDVARIPEALDRGTDYFSRYLHSILEECGVKRSEAHICFTALAAPSRPSVLAKEQLDFARLVADAEESGTVGGSGRRRIELAPEIGARLRDHWQAWRHLGYHGYGTREPYSLDHYYTRLELMLKDAGHVRELLHGERDSSLRREDERQYWIERLSLDEPPQQAFRFFGEIGRVKLLRRSSQLRNFFHLDILLEELAQRFAQSESAFRLMLPDEIYELRDSGYSPDWSSISRRRDGCILALVGTEELLYAGSEVTDIADRLRSSSMVLQNDQGVLQGVVAQQGEVTAKCEIVIRREDGREFEPGSILVSEATDPDIVDLFSLCSAVVTEQGGVASHAALICREMGIPAVIGVRGLLDAVSSGDVLHVDGYQGRVAIVEKARSKRDPSIFVPGDSADSDMLYGRKAALLARAARAGFRVPPFFVASCDRLRPELTSRGSQFESMVQQLAGRVASRTGYLAVRSSALSEDSLGGSQAGQFTSLVNVPVQDVTDALVEFIERNDSIEGHYTGGVVLQECVTGDYAGVALSRFQSAKGEASTLLVEAAPTSNWSVTAGRGNPFRIEFDREGGDVLFASEDTPDDLRRAVRTVHEQVVRCEELFGWAADVEWLTVDGEFVLLQVRPIVGSS